ncbi:MAG: glycosyltransferase [Glaciihabitans sp.]|nr:glycosyltransferase [Glaciihabitans sp.]
MITDNELDSRLGHADPGARLPVADSTLDDLLVAARMSGRRRPRHLTLVTTIAVGALVAVGVGTLPVAADAVRSFVGLEVENAPPGGGTEDILGSAWFNTNATDLDKFVASRYPEDLPLPRGVDPAEVAAAVAFSIGGSDAIMQEIGVDSGYESYFYCRWVDVWLVGDKTGDLRARDAATVVMQEATAWPALVATDGGGVVDQQKKFATAAAAGDRDGVESAWTMNSCQGWKSMGAGG